MLLVVAGRLAVHREFERAEVVLGGDGHVSALLDLGKRRRIGSVRDGEGGGTDQQAATGKAGCDHGGSSFLPLEKANLVPARNACSGEEKLCSRGRVRREIPPCLRYGQPQPRGQS